MNNIELLRRHKQLTDLITQILNKYDFNPSEDLYIPTETPDTIMINFYDCDENIMVYIAITNKECIIINKDTNKTIKTKYAKKAKEIQKLIFNDNQ